MNYLIQATRTTARKDSFLLSTRPRPEPDRDIEMNNKTASLVFVIDNSAAGNRRLTLNVQRGDVSKRVGPFIGLKTGEPAIALLPDNDRILLERLVQNGLISGRYIDPKFNLLPEVANAVASHKNLFVKSQRFGSIRRALALDRQALLQHIPTNSSIQPGSLINGEIEIVDDNSFRIWWRYEKVSVSVPYSPPTDEVIPIGTTNGETIVRNLKMESEKIRELSAALLLPSFRTTDNMFMVEDISLLYTLSKDKWTFLYRGNKLLPQKAHFDDSGIAWFESKDSTDLSQSLEPDALIKAYLAGRHHIETDGKLIFLPPSAAESVSNNAALMITTFGNPDVPVSALMSIRKSFSNEERTLIREQLKNANFMAQLREYQLDGVLWLNSLRNANLGGILADEMGLGKTIQTLAYMLCASVKTTLIIAPASVIPNWKSEIARLAPNQFSTLYELSSNSLADKKVIYIISYQTALRNNTALRSLSFELFVLDEGQFVKNVETKTARSLRNVTSTFRLVLTGTPIENSVKDLWAHLTFVNPFLDKSYHKLIRKFPDFGKNRAAADLSIKAFGGIMLRRTKREVEVELPPLTERIIYCDMRKSQRVIYDKTLFIFRKMLRSGVAARVSSIALEALLRLRQCCSYPLLLPNSLNKGQVSDSIKIDIALDIVEDDMREGRKTIVFAQFKKVLDRIEKDCRCQGVGVVRLDGETVNREVPVKLFQNDAQIKVFLIGFRAGGFGLNLTAAESVILFDPWWNPAAEAQAFARAHRIGQNKAVFVSKLICRNTIEEKMIELVKKKMEIVDRLSVTSEGMSTGDLIEIIGYDFY